MAEKVAFPEVLEETDFPELGKRTKGKVRDIYEQDGRLILITTDRQSAFDRHIALIPHKGQVLNQLSAWWFSATADVVPNHIEAVPDPNATVAKKLQPLPVEAVMRGYITGVTSTSLYTHYEKGKRDFGNFTLPDGLKKNEKLPEPVFTPSTKSDAHDETLSPEEIVARGVVPRDIMERVEEASRALYARGQDIAKSRGLILVDTKYEFGLGEDGTLVLIDEVHTPDSSRFWQLSSYEERFGKGEAPEHFDKEFLRLWFIEHSDPYADAVLPEAPPELVETLSKKYIHMYEQITGESFLKGETPILTRLERNLKPYAR